MTQPIKSGPEQVAENKPTQTTGSDNEETESKRDIDHADAEEHEEEFPELLTKLFSEINKNEDKYKNNLKEAVAFQSISSDPTKRDALKKIMEWTAEYMKKLNIQVELKDLGNQTLNNNKEIPLPPVIFGSLQSNDKGRNTVLIYGHLDTTPAVIEPGSKTDPFTLKEKDDILYGKGTSDDKGPVLSWLHAIEAYQTLKIDIPVNIKFVIEGMEESGSLGLKELLQKEKKFVQGVDFVCISDCHWLTGNKPSLIHGLRGHCYFNISIQSSSEDLHGGRHGGTVYEPMTDLIYLLSKLVDKRGVIQIPEIYNDVPPFTEGEREIYDNIDFSLTNHRKNVGCEILLHEDKEELLKHVWRYPSLSIHGIEGAFSGEGENTVIPVKVTGKFSIRTVPNHTVARVEKYVKEYLVKKWNEYESPNKMLVTLKMGINPWYEEPTNVHYEAAVKAVSRVYEVQPDITREGVTIPVVLTLEEATRGSIVILPIGSSDDKPHSIREKINLNNYINGAKLLGAYLYEVGQI